MLDLLKKYRPRIHLLLLWLMFLVLVCVVGRFVFVPSRYRNSTSISWGKFSAIALSRVIEKNQPVLVAYHTDRVGDFWPIENTVNQPEVIRLFAEKRVELMKAVYTDNPADFSTLLAAIAKQNNDELDYPIIVLYERSGETHLIQNLPNASDLLAALKQID